MSLYMAQFGYTAETWSRLIEQPKTASAVSAMVEPHGAKLVDLWYAFGESDGFAVTRCPEPQIGGGDRDGHHLEWRVSLVRDDPVDDPGRSARGDAYGPPDPLRGAGRGRARLPLRRVSRRRTRRSSAGRSSPTWVKSPPAARLDGTAGERVHAQRGVEVGIPRHQHAGGGVDREQLARARSESCTPPVPATGPQ